MIVDDLELPIERYEPIPYDPKVGEIYEIMERMNAAVRRLLLTDKRLPLSGDY